MFRGELGSIKLVSQQNASSVKRASRLVAEPKRNTKIGRSPEPGTFHGLPKVNLECKNGKIGHIFQMYQLTIRWAGTGEKKFL